MGQVYDDQEYLGNVSGVATSTRAVASYAVLTNPVQVVIPAAGAIPEQDPTRAESLTWLEIDACAAVNKITSGTGSLSVWYNGVMIADSERVVLFGIGEIPYSWHGLIPIPSAAAANAAQTIELRAASSDTATFSIAKARLLVTRVRTPGGLN